MACQHFHRCSANDSDCPVPARYLESMADGIQILRYKPKQAYIGHHDYFPTGQSDDFNWDPKSGGSNRFATLLLYLSDVSEGGGTVFTLKPNATATDVYKDKSVEELVGGSDAEKLFSKNSQPWEKELVKTCFTNFRMLPKKGDAILFYVRLSRFLSRANCC
jgi:prolyl 4-hydroxylase